jgi:8-hydroxy-5-deazaflavin:NADPH oxidoreductase
MKRKIGVIGSGQVARALANGFLKYGHSVMMGSREPGKLSDWRSKAGQNASVGNFAETARFADIVVLAVAGTAAEDAVKQAQPVNLKGKTVIDVTNPISKDPPVNGVLRFFTSFDESLMERLQRLVPNANFVKAFNSVGNALMVNPNLPGGPPTMFICGNDESAKKDVRQILDEFGWETADMGKAEASRAIEPLCILWCIPGFLQNDWVHAFKVLKA